MWSMGNIVNDMVTILYSDGGQMDGGDQFIMYINAELLCVIHLKPI